MTVTLCLYCSPDVGVYSIGAFRGPPQSGVAFPTTSGLWLSGILLATASGVSKDPLGRVWLSLPHLVSTVWKSASNCFGTPNSTELNNNSTPTRSPTGFLNRMFNRHQAEITVMQFRGYSLLVHHNGTFTLSHLISFNPPTRCLPITGHWNVSLPSGVSPWNSIFGPGRRSKYNTGTEPRSPRPLANALPTWPMRVLSLKLVGNY